MTFTKNILAITILTTFIAGIFTTAAMAEDTDYVITKAVYTTKSEAFVIQNAIFNVGVLEVKVKEEDKGNR